MTDTKNRVAIIIMNDDNEILIEHATGKSWETHGWDLPKGHIEEGEKEEVAAVRECYEETHIKVDPEQLQFKGNFKYQSGTMSVYYIKLNLDVSKMICTTYFETPWGVKKPEVDKYKYVGIGEFEGKVYKGVCGITLPIIKQIIGERQ